jgi:hypothetical protein
MYSPSIVIAFQEASTGIPVAVLIISLSPFLQAIRCFARQGRGRRMGAPQQLLQCGSGDFIREKPILLCDRFDDQGAEADDGDP